MSGEGHVEMAPAVAHTSKTDIIQSESQSSPSSQPLLKALDVEAGNVDSGEVLDEGNTVQPGSGHDADIVKTRGSRSRGNLNGQILALALPALVSLSVDPLMSAVDTAYIGRLGPDLGGGEAGLGALGLNTYIFTFAFYVFNFLATVPTPFVASARARGDEQGAAKLVGQLLTSALAFGLVLMLVLELSGPSLLSLMGSTPANEAEALQFLRARALSAPAVLAMSVGNGAFRGFLDTKTPLLIAVGANAINFILDPILIFQLGMGVQGAAIATVAAEWSGAIAFIYLLGKKEPAIRLQSMSLPSSRENWEQSKAVAISSAAVFGRSVALQAALSTASAFAARAGPTSIAAHQVASQLWLLLAFAADSIAVAAQGLIADRIGANMIEAAREVAGRVLLLSIAWGSGLLVLFQLFGGALPRIFTTNDQVLAALVPVITVVGLMQPINTYVFVGDGVLQGSQDFVYEAMTMAVSASVGAGYIISRAHVGDDGIGLLDVWVGLAIMQASRATTFSLRHWLDPRGPLAPAKASMRGVDGEGTEEDHPLGDGRGCKGGTD